MEYKIEKGVALPQKKSWSVIKYAEIPYDKMEVGDSVPLVQIGPNKDSASSRIAITRKYVRTAIEKLQAGGKKITGDFLVDQLEKKNEKGEITGYEIRIWRKA